MRVRYQTGAALKKYLPLLANLAGQTIFGFAYIFIKMGMAVVDQNSIKFLAFRFVLGFLAMTLLVVFGLQKVHYKNRPVYLILICGLLNPMISQIVETTATTYAPASQMSLFNSVLPVTMLVFSALINHEYPTRRQVMLVFVVVGGVLIANMADKVEAGLTTIGLVLIIGLNITLAIQRVLVRRTSAVFNSFDIIYLTTGMGALFFTVLSLGGHAIAHGSLAGYFTGLMTPRFGISLLYMGLGSCVGAFLLTTYASANLPFAVYSATCSLSTVVGILSGVVFLGERFTWIEVVGTAVILVGVIGIGLSYDAGNKEGNRFRLDKS